MACFLKSNSAMWKIIAKPNHGLYFWKNQIASWFGKGVFGKSNRTMQEIIAKLNLVLFFLKSQNTSL
jgi:hypothetical protein